MVKKAYSIHNRTHVDISQYIKPYTFCNSGTCNHISHPQYGVKIDCEALKRDHPYLVVRLTENTIANLSSCHQELVCKYEPHDPYEQKEQSKSQKRRSFLAKQKEEKSWKALLEKYKIK